MAVNCSNFLPELTVNWHVREECNFSCEHCYAKYARRSVFTTKYEAVLCELASLQGKSILLGGTKVTVGSVRINFAGGEPFLEKSLQSAIKAARDLGLSVSFISNGLLIRDAFVRSHGPLISTAGISIDSFSAETNAEIGRESNRGLQFGIDEASSLFDLFRQTSPATRLKINTVVCVQNKDEDMRSSLEHLSPDRWKVLRVIPIHGGKAISDEEFADFLWRHSDVPNMVVETNEHMHRSYLMVDPSGCFYQRNGSEYFRSRPVTEIGAEAALAGVQFDLGAYLSRY